jgi:hypothetical protein
MSRTSATAAPPGGTAPGKQTSAAEQQLAARKELFKAGDTAIASGTLTLKVFNRDLLPKLNAAPVEVQAEFVQALADRLADPSQVLVVDPDVSRVLGEDIAPKLKLGLDVLHFSTRQVRAEEDVFGQSAAEILRREEGVVLGEVPEVDGVPRHLPLGAYAANHDELWTVKPELWPENPPEQYPFEMGGRELAENTLQGAFITVKTADGLVTGIVGPHPAQATGLWVTTEEGLPKLVPSGPHGHLQFLIDAREVRFVNAHHKAWRLGPEPGGEAVKLLRGQLGDTALGIQAAEKLAKMLVEDHSTARQLTDAELSKILPRAAELGVVKIGARELNPIGFISAGRATSLISSLLPDWSRQLHDRRPETREMVAGIQKQQADKVAPWVLMQVASRQIAGVSQSELEPALWPVLRAIERVEDPPIEALASRMRNNADVWMAHSEALIQAALQDLREHFHMWPAERLDAKVEVTKQALLAALLQLKKSTDS